MTADSPNPARQDTFVTTRWTQVLSARGASPEAQVALSDLCEAYWQPVYRFIRRTSASDDGAKDLTQGFFAQLLAGRGIDQVESGKGRFRSYLLGAVKHYLSDQRDCANAAKRGGGAEIVPLELSAETHTTATGLQIPDPSAMVPDSFFDREWALNVLDRALNALAAEMAAAGKERHFEVLKPWLVGETGRLPHDEAIRQLSLSEGAFKVAIYRLRRRFRDLLKDEIAGTVAQGGTVQEELRYLQEALRHS